MRHGAVVALTSTVIGLAALAGGIALVIWAADMLVDGLLGVGRALGIAPFVLTVALSGFETENLVAGIAANTKGLPRQLPVRFWAASPSWRSEPRASAA